MGLERSAVHDVGSDCQDEKGSEGADADRIGTCMDVGQDILHNNGKAKQHSQHAADALPTAQEDTSDHKRA